MIDLVSPNDIELLIRGSIAKIIEENESYIQDIELLNSFVESEHVNFNHFIRLINGCRRVTYIGWFDRIFAWTMRTGPLSETQLKPKELKIIKNTSQKLKDYLTQARRLYD